MAAKGITLPIIYKSDDSGLKQAGKQLDGFGKTVAKIGGLIAGAFAIGKITSFAKESILAAEAVATADARIKQIAESTQVFGAATEEVTGRLIALAEANEIRLATDSNVIKSVQGQLLSFKQLSASADETGGAFDRATMAAFDMAAAGFGSAESNAVALGKALEDPIRGVSALARTGTVFTEEQKEQIRVLQESGDLIGAQELILGELESQYQGVAAATADASDQLALAGQNIKENFGEALLPIFNELVQGLLPVFDEIGIALGGAMEAAAPMLQDLAAQIPGLLQGFIPLIPILVQLAGLFIQLVAAALPFISRILEAIIPVMEALLPVLIDAISSAIDPLMNAFMTLVDAALPLVDMILPIIASLIGTLAPLFAQLIAQLAPMIAEILPPLAELFFAIIEAIMPLVMALLPVIIQLITAMAPIVITLIEAFLPLVEMILPLLIGAIEFLIPLIEWLAELFSVIIVAAIEIFLAMIENTTSAIDAFSTFFQDTWENLKSFFQAIINSLIGGFEGFVNGAIRGINKVIGAINNLRWDVPWWVPGIGGQRFGFNIPTLSEISLPRVQLAEGGIVTAPTRALIGEAGPEAVIPLDKLGPMAPTYNITINAGVGDPVRIGEEVVNAIKRYERVSGPVFMSA